MATLDRSIVTLRPKYYVGSTGSVWASDYVRLRYLSVNFKAALEVILYIIMEKKLSNWRKPLHHEILALFTNI